MNTTRRTDTHLADRLDFLGLGAEQRETLAALQPVVKATIGASLDAFYAKAKGNPETARHFANDAHIQHAKSRQEIHWAMISTGRFNDDYVEAVSAIGRTHARLGLEPRWYIGGYALILEGIFDAVIGAEIKGFGQAARSRRLKNNIGAIMKAAMLDMDYSISVYLETLEAERQKAQAERLQSEAEQDAVIAALETALKALASGNLAATIDKPLAPRFDAVKQNYNHAVAALSTAFSEIIDETQLASDTAQELSTATDDMARRTEQQAAALEQTAAALEQITALSRQSAQRTEEAKIVAVSSASEAVRSGEVVGRAVTAMSDIESSSKKIGQIIGVIDEISFQTNLLALNAGVEAARAGESGRGFAVVAHEVRELAQRSAAAAKEIKELIAQSSKDVAQGVDLVHQTGEALRNIGGQVHTINEHIAAITTAAAEQSVGVGEINSAVNNMDQMTQQNAAMVEQTNASTQNLRNISAHLMTLVSRFAVGRNARREAAPAAARNRHAA